MRVPKSLIPASLTLWLATCLLFQDSLSLRTTVQASQGDASPDWMLLLPEADGKEYVGSLCSTCHSIKQVIDQRGDKAVWESRVYEMIGYGAQIYDDEVEVVADYLAAHFHFDVPLVDFPIKLNAATAGELGVLPLEDGAAEKIVQKRDENGRFESMAEVEELLGSEQYNKIKSFLALGPNGGESQ